MSRYGFLCRNRCPVNLSKHDLALVLEVLDLKPNDQPLVQVALEEGAPLTASAIRQRASGQVGLLSDRQIQRRLNALVELSVLQRVGAGPSTAYQANAPAIARAYLCTDYLKRDRKEYDPTRVEAYRPNESRRLPEALGREMRELSDTAIEAGVTINDVIFRRLMIDTAWASSRMEGNTYTLGETEALIEEGIEPADRTAAETQMIRNHAEAVETLILNARDLELSVHTLRGLHGILSRGLLGNSDQEGAIRKRPVFIGKSSYIPLADPHRLEEGLRVIVSKACQIEDAFEQSFFLLTEIPYLQPFDDVNKRVGRIAANLPLLSRGLCPMTYYGLDDSDYIHGILAFYELGVSDLLAETLHDAYRQGVERYKSYFHTLSDGDAVRRAFGREINSLVRAYVRGVDQGKVEPEDWQSFFRGRLSRELDTSTRDAITVAAKASLNTLDSARAISVGLKPAEYQRYLDYFNSTDS